MLSKSEFDAIKKLAEKTLRNKCIGFNQTIDTDKLLQAISEAIADSIKLYDQIKN